MAEIEYHPRQPGSRIRSLNQYTLLAFIQPTKQANKKLIFIIRIRFGKAFCGLTGKEFLW